MPINRPKRRLYEIAKDFNDDWEVGEVCYIVGESFYYTETEKIPGWNVYFPKHDYNSTVPKGVLKPHYPKTKFGKWYKLTQAK